MLPVVLQVVRPDVVHGAPPTQGRVDSGVRRSVLFRLLALVLALTAGLGGPGHAVAHGLAHDHVRQAHHAHGAPHAAVAPGHDADAAWGAAVTLGAPAHDHAHRHAAVDVALGERAVDRVPLAAVVLAADASLLPPAADQRLAYMPALSDHALLARSDPATGPPPRLRAPPVG